MSEPRDRAYALYGALLALGARLAHPDYTKSVDQIFRELFINLLHWRPAALVLLLDAGGRKNAGEPGWVPQSSSSARSTWVPEHVICNATLGNAVSVHGSPIFEIRSSSLCVLARRRETVKYVFAVPSPRNSQSAILTPDNEYLMDTFEWLTSILKTVNLRSLFWRPPSHWISLGRQAFFQIVGKYIAPFMDLGEHLPSALDAWAHTMFNLSYDIWGRCTVADKSLAT